VTSDVSRECKVSIEVGEALCLSSYFLPSTKYEVGSKCRIHVKLPFNLLSKAVM